jgi:hypothetical protein
MSVQKALIFLANMRWDAAMRSALIARQDEVGLDDLCALARGQGLVFDASHLQEAFRADWALRVLRRQHASFSAAD